MAGQNSQIKIDSSALRDAAQNIQENISQIQTLVTNINQTVEGNSGAYGQGDVDRQSIMDSAHDIQDTLADNAGTLDTDIQAILAFATKLENSSSKS